MPQTDDDSFIAQALPAFIAEAEEQSIALEQLLLQLEDAPGDRELLDALFRCAHTIKGSAGLFGLDDVVAFTHHVETLLDLVREGRCLLTPALSTLLLQCNDATRQLVAAASRPATDDDGAATLARAALVQQLQAACAGAAATAPVPQRDGTVAAGPLRRWRLQARFGVDTFRNGMDPAAVLAYLRGLGTLAPITCAADAVPPLDALDPESCHLGFDFGLSSSAPLHDIDAAFDFVRDDCTLQIDEIVAEAAPAPRAAAAGGSDDTRFIRVQADRLDVVINLLGELVTASAGASLLARETRQAALIEANAQIAGLVQDIRNSTLQLRMVAIGETFARFRRVVRDTAAELGKDVLLDIVGGDTELDKSVVERVADPLMHLVRNALDHGLETAAERVAAGKPAQGRLTLSARHESGSILIRIVDDGRGIARDKVLERAWQQGLVERGVVPPDDAVLDLIFRPGFSTAEKVTNLSGRGVGMDVVRRNIEALRGSVTLASTPGAGSCIEIRLPLTLAIIDGFLVGVGRSKFILPLDSVVEVIEDRPTTTTTACDARGRSLVELRGRVLPVVSLRKLYALDSPAPERCSVVVLQAGHSRCGLMVDTLMGQHQTVIKPMGPLFQRLRGISGSSILGNGEVALIFDVAALHQLAAEAPAARQPDLAPEGQPS